LRGALAVLTLTGLGCVAANAQEQKPEGQFDCLIQPKMVLKLGTAVPGLLKEVLVDRGAMVKKGDVVARLESGVEEAAQELAKVRSENDSTVRSSMAKLEFQRRKDERARQLRKSDAVTISVADEAETGARVAEQELDEAKVNLAIAKLDLDRATEVLKQRTIRSPINGVVVERTLGPGEYVYDQSHIVTISQIDPLNVEVYVPLGQFGKIRVGTPAEVYPEEPVGGSFDAKVTVVDQVFDAASGTIGVRLELPNPNYAIPAGLKCRVRFPGIG
jgi:RND family efflux transporter MFP subunit